MLNRQLHSVFRILFKNKINLVLRSVSVERHFLILLHRASYKFNIFTGLEAPRSKHVLTYLNLSTSDVISSQRIVGFVSMELDATTDLVTRCL